jgi:nucleoside-diphosphate-sugar epimerase
MNQTDNKLYDIGIFGCAGFLASQLIKKLVAEKFKILAIGPMPPDCHDKNIKYIPFDMLKPQKTGYDTDEMCVKTFIYSAVKKGRYEKGTQAWEEQGAISAPDFTSLFKFLNLDISRLITLGSSEEYGPKNSENEIQETDPINPVTSYGFWKTELLAKAHLWTSKQGIDFVHLRPFIIFGEGQDETMFLGSLIKTLLKGDAFDMTRGEQWRSFIYVQSICELITFLHQSASWKYDVVNISGPNYLQIATVARSIHKTIQNGRLNIGSLPYRPFEVWHQKPSLDRLQAMVPQLKFNSFNHDISHVITHYQAG